MYCTYVTTSLRREELLPVTCYLLRPSYLFPRPRMRDRVVYISRRRKGTSTCPDPSTTHLATLTSSCSRVPPLPSFYLCTQPDQAHSSLFK